MADAVPSGGPHARVKASVTWGLNVRSSLDTSSLANVLASVPAGTQLLLLEPDGMAKVGAINQWVRVRTPQGQEGFAAAWYLEKALVEAPAPATEPPPPSTSGAPAPAPEAPSTPTPVEPPKEKKLVVIVSDAVGTGGLRMRKVASLGSALVMPLKAGTKLTVLEPANKARAKIGQANQWLSVREPDGRRGYVSAQFVLLP